MAFPSAGCQTCKIRRIKCDEAQPVCQRCQKSKRVCHGMRSGKISSVIHNENSYASGQKKRPRGPRSSSASTPSKLISKNRNTIPQQLPRLDLKTQALMYYLRYHLQSRQDILGISKGILDDFLPIWQPGSEQCPLLDLAITSIALAVFSRTQNYPTAALQASLNYHELLQITQTKIISLDGKDIDLCLFAIFFMSRYEDSVHCPPPTNHQNIQEDAHTPTSFTTTLLSIPHHDGALAILKIWKFRLSCTQAVTDVIKHTRRGMIRSALLRNQALPDWILDGSFFGEQDGLELEYDSIVVRITDLRQRLSMLLKDREREKTCSALISDEVTSSTIEALNEEARNIDKALQDWTTHFPETWSYTKHILPSSDVESWPTTDFCSPMVYSYISPAYAAVWNSYHANRLLINSTRLRILKLMASLNSTNSPRKDLTLQNENENEKHQLECLSRMKILANDLASSIPSSLQRFNLIKDKDTESHAIPIKSDADPNINSEEGEENSRSQKSIISITNDEDIDPYLASLTVWPLSIASGLGNMDADVELRLWFRGMLARLGRVLGTRALECAESDQWLEL